MSEEEVIKELDKVFWQQVKNNKNSKLWFEINYDDTQRLAKAIQGLLDLYNKEFLKNYNSGYISKDKIREKIKEYETTINQNKLMAIKVRQHGFAQETIIQNMIRAKVEILKELLEENESNENNI